MERLIQKNSLLKVVWNGKTTSILTQEFLLPSSPLIWSISQWQRQKRHLCHSGQSRGRGQNGDFYTSSLGRGRKLWRQCGREGNLYQKQVLWLHLQGHGSSWESSSRPMSLLPRTVCTVIASIEGLCLFCFPTNVSSCSSFSHFPKYSGHNNRLIILLFYLLYINTKEILHLNWAKNQICHIHHEDILYISSKF